MTLPKGKKKSLFLIAFSLIIFCFTNILRPTTNSSTSELVASKFLEYYFSFQDAKKFEEESDFVQAADTYNRASALLKEIQSLDPSWRTAFISVKLRELKSAIALMRYRQIMLEADNLVSSGQVEQAKENYLKARNMLDEIKLNTPGWREDQISTEMRIVENAILSPKNDISEKHNSIAQRNSQKIDDFLPIVSLPQEMSPLPRAVSTVPSPVDESYTDEIKKNQPLLSDTQAKQALITNERDDLNQRVVQQQALFEKEITQLREINSILTKELDEIKNRLRTREEEINKLKQNRIEESIKSLNERLNESKTALEEATAKIKVYEKENESLRERLKQMEKQLASLSQNQFTGKKTEHDVLKGILLRLSSQQKRRDEARNAALAEVSRLNIQSSELLKQLEILSAPIITDLEIDIPSSKEPRTKKLTAAKTELEESIQITPEGEASNQPKITISQSEDSSEPELPESLSLLAEQADRFFSEGKIQEAADLYEEIILREPNNSSMLANYGVVCLKLGRSRIALAAMERAVEISPDDAFALNMLGIVHFYLGETDSTHFQKAYDTLIRAVEIEPENARIRNYLGIAAFSINKPDVAERELRKAIELSADYPEAHFNMSVVYINQNPPALEMARRHYIRSVQLGHPRHMSTEEKLNISENDISQLAITGLR